MSRTRSLVLVTAILCAAGLGQAGKADAAELFYGVDTSNRLVAFNSTSPNAISRVSFTGLPAGEQIVGLDVRPLDRQLFGMSSASRLYRITPTGSVTVVGTAPFVPPLAGTSFGFDFNPTVDRIRVTADTRQNLRLHPDTGATAAVDGALTYASGDAGAGSTPRVVGSAYTNSVAGATSTTLFALDAGRDVLAIQNPPNAGTLVSVGSLGVNAGDNAGFDISAVDGVAYAALQVASNVSSSLYRINLTSGAATPVGRIGGSTAIRALAAVGTAPADTAAPSLGIAPRYSRKVRRLLRTGVTLRATCSESCRITARILLGRRQIGGGRTISTDLAGATTFRVGFTTAAKRRYARNRRLTLTLVVTARDASGNTVTKRVRLSARR